LVSAGVESEVTELTIQSKKKGDLLQLAIEDEMTIYTAALQKNELLGYLDDCQELEVDLSAVSEIDSAGLQILLMLKQEADRGEKNIHLVNHSQAVVEVFELLNVAGHFGDPVVIPAEWQSK
jgi:anti-anti-sigma factor